MQMHEEPSKNISLLDFCLLLRIESDFALHR